MISHHYVRGQVLWEITVEDAKLCTFISIVTFSPVLPVCFVLNFVEFVSLKSDIYFFYWKFPCFEEK